MPAPASSLPEWATTANYGAGSDPWSGQPRRDNTGMAALAAAGLVPAEPTPADTFNAWLGLASEWIVHFDTELANVIAGGYADGSATDSTLVDALDTKANLAGGNTWAGTQVFGGAIDVNAASTVDALMTFSVAPSMPSWRGAAGLATYSGPGLDPHATVPFFAQHVEAGGGSGPNYVLTIHADLVESCGIIDLHFLVWNDGADTATGHSAQILFYSAVGSPPVVDQDLAIRTVNGGVVNVSATVIDASANNVIRLYLSVTANGTYNVAGWYRIIRADTTQ